MFGPGEKTEKSRGAFCSRGAARGRPALGRRLQPLEALSLSLSGFRRLLLHLFNFFPPSRASRYQEMHRARRWLVFISVGVRREKEGLRGDPAGFFSQPQRERERAPAAWQVGWREGALGGEIRCGGRSAGAVWGSPGCMDSVEPRAQGSPSLRGPRSAGGRADGRVARSAAAAVAAAAPEFAGRSLSSLFLPLRSLLSLSVSLFISVSVSLSLPLSLSEPADRSRGVCANLPWSWEHRTAQAGGKAAGPRESWGPGGGPPGLAFQPGQPPGT